MIQSPNLSIKIGSLILKNPVLLASGTCGYGMELDGLLDLDQVGGIIIKGISIKPRPGNHPPRLVETPCGLLNSIGLENVGIELLEQQGADLGVGLPSPELADFGLLEDVVAPEDFVGSLTGEYHL